jgi:hypothetical protein
VSVGGNCAGVRVDVRTSQSDANTSLLADKQARETTPGGKVTVFLEDDGDIGKRGRNRSAGHFGAGDSLPAHQTRKLTS